MFRRKLPIYIQHDTMDCGPACLRMIAKYYGRGFSLDFLRERAQADRAGVSLLALAETAESIGLRSLAVKTDFEQLRQLPLPCVAWVRQNHFVVVYEVTGSRVMVGDPAEGIIRYARAEFMSHWARGDQEGLCLLFEPAPGFYSAEFDEEASNTSGFRFLFSYLNPHKRFLAQLSLSLFIGGALQLALPFLTQALVDAAISQHDLRLIWLILAAQLVIFLSRTAVELLRSRLLLYISARINISLISDFLVKLMKAPLPFFERKLTGDILQRIGDHQRIESFLSVSVLGAFFSFLTLVALTMALAAYSSKALLVFLAGAALSGLWIALFLRKRARIDQRRFSQQAENQSLLIQLIGGIQEIKLRGAEKQKRWEWERRQAKLFQLSLSSLALEQWQQTGASLLNQLRTLMITLLVAQDVIGGSMTLGMMLAIASILGQLDGPIDQALGFARAAQDARLSLARLGEVRQSADEQPSAQPHLISVPTGEDIIINRLSFSYSTTHLENVLEDISLRIPRGKVTAIVGASGSGKTTLLKLLLKLYRPTGGEIKLGKTNLSRLDHRAWRRKCGVVMQDGFIFTDTIARNIALGEEVIDQARMLYAARTANIHEFIESLPLAYETMIGRDGQGLSQGQKQRLLIARAVYLDHDYLFFDEATSALDARNERVIMENLYRFFERKTVVIIAHRLSTVKIADQIVVLEDGRIAEQGNHFELAGKQGVYYHLVRNQLELGS